MLDISIFQAVTLAIAFLGAALGVINTWTALDKNRLKLRVVPQHAIPVGGAPSHVNFCISVTNMSSFAVTVDDVGVFYRGTEERASFISPILADGGPWPRRLEPRTSVTVYGERPRPHQGRKIRTAYARTACGATTVGSSPALRQISSGEIDF